MRVLQVNDHPPGPGGGAEVHLGQLCRGLERTGDEVRVFAGRASHRGFGKALDLWDPWARRDLLREIRVFRPDVVHHHNVLRELSVSVVPPPAGVGAVMTVHDFRLLGAPDRPEPTVVGVAKKIKGALDRAVVRRSLDAMIGVSRYMAEQLLTKGFPGVHHVPYAVPEFGERGEPAPPSARTDVVFVGRLAPDKGVRVLVDAFERIAERYPASGLVLVGDGPERPGLEARADGSAGRVRLLGRVDGAGVREALEGARVVAVPSLGRLEGSPLVALEAALAGRPLVVSDDPGLAELVGDARCGVVVPRGDAAALATGLDRFLGAPSDADELGARARAHVLEHHAIEVVVPQVRAIYERVMERVRGG